MLHSFNQEKRFVHRCMSVLLILSFIIATFILYPPAAFAANTTIRVGYCDSDGITVDAEGNYSGYAVDYLEEIAQLTGWEYEYVQDSWEGCMDALERGDVDLLCMAFYTPERAKRFLYSNMDICTSYIALYAKDDSDIYYHDHEAFDGYTIGVASGTYFETAVRQHNEEFGLNCEIVIFPTEAEAKEAIFRGEIDMLATGSYTSHTDLKMVDRFSMNPMYILTGKENKALMDRLNSAINGLKIEKPDLEFRLNNKYNNVSTASLHLTREEQEFIDSTEAIDIRIFNHSLPLFTYEGDEIVGIIPDYLDALGEIADLKFNYIRTSTESALEEIPYMEEDGSLLLTANTSLSKESDFIRSRSIMQLNMTYIKLIEKSVNFSPSSVAVPLNMPFLKSILPEQYTILWCDTIEDCLDAVMKGDADTTVLFDFVANYMLQRPQYASKLMAFGVRDYAVDMYLYGSEDYALLFSILSKIQEVMTEADQTAILGNTLLNYPYKPQFIDTLYKYNWLVLVSLLASVSGIFITVLYRKSINERKELQKKAELQRQLWTDHLTGLYNREGFLANAHQMIRDLNGDAAIIRVNIWHLKQFNELYGMENGDMIISEVSRRLKKLKEHMPIELARFSADKFYLCVPGSDINNLSFVRLIDIPSLSLSVNTTYGVYHVGNDPDAPINVMCDRADLAVASAKPTADQYVHYYSDAENQRHHFEQMIEHDMEAAIAENQFTIYVQPKYDVTTEVIIGGEVLVRWLHPEHGLLMPYSFIELFERNGFIRKMDYCVWEKCCQYLSQLKDAGVPLIPMAVNMSRIHFYSHESIRKLKELLDKYGLEPANIDLEITESMCAESPDMLFDQCRQLREMGFRIAMDDFGSGYSSLSVLKEMPIDTLKMDLRFLSYDDSADQADRGHRILRSTIEMAHDIGLDVVVEGLETREQRDFIREIGNCGAQGYYYAKPMCTDDFTELLKTSNLDEGKVPTFGLAANLRRERLRKEQLQPLLEMIEASENIFGYLLPEKEGVLSLKLAEARDFPQRVPDLAERTATSGRISPESIVTWMNIFKSIDEGQRSGASIVEYVDKEGEKTLQWIRFDTILDFDGNPLIAMFTIDDFRNITSHVEALIDSKVSQAEIENRRLKENERLLSIVTQHSDRVMCIYDIASRSSRVWKHEDCQHCAEPRLCEIDVDTLLNSDLLTPESQQDIHKMLEDIHSGNASGNLKLQICSENEDIRWMDIMYTTIFDKKGEPASALLSYKNVTKQHEQEMAFLRQYQSLSETESSLGVMEVDLTEDRIELQESLFAPDGYAHHTVGGSLTEFAEQMITLKMQPEDWEDARAFFNPQNMIQQHDMGNRLLTRTWPMVFHSGKFGWVRFDIELIADIYSGHIRSYFRLWDVTDIKESEMKLQERSERDGLTGLYNRVTVEEFIGEKLQTEASPGIFIILDMDHLKQINDSYGHSEGDKAIRIVADTIRSHFRSSDIVGRIGGDEFVVYMPGAAKNKDVISSSIMDLVRKLSMLSVGDDEDMSVTCSIGCVVAQKDSTYSSLYRQADKAMYHVKKNGKNNFAFYTDEMENDAFVFHLDKLFSLDHAKRAESRDVQNLITVLSSYYHLVLSCNITENSYHMFQEVKDGIFAQMPTFGKMDTMVKLSMMRMSDEDAKRFDDAVSRQALIRADEAGLEYVHIDFEFLDFDNVYYPAECTSILYRNEKDDLCEFALIRWKR
ncbi:MAG: EAL domain-containing protein [Firmicutes bacterium]|nr:EAL domain-containing protein [Bacillota bacterium]